MANPSYIDADGVISVTEAWVGLGATTLGSDTATVTFTSPDDGSSLDWSQFMDLVVIVYARGEQTSVYDNGTLRFATGGGSVDSGANYASQYVTADGSSVGAGPAGTTFVGIRTLGTSAGTNEFAAVIVHIFDINSGKYKSVVTQAAGDSDGNGFVRLGAETWKNQGAIDKMTFAAGTGDLVAGSMFSLFGVLPRMAA